MCTAPTAFDAQIAFSLRPDRLSFIYFIFPFVQFFLFLFICANSHIGFPIPNHLVVTLVAGFWQIDESRLAVRDSQPQGEGVMPFIPFGDGGSFLFVFTQRNTPFRFFFSRRGAVFVKRCHHSRAYSGDARRRGNRASGPTVGRIRTTPNPTRHRRRRASFQKERCAATRAREPNARERFLSIPTRVFIFIHIPLRALVYSHLALRQGKRDPSVYSKP